MGGGVSTDSLTDDQKGNVMDKIAKVMDDAPTDATAKQTLDSIKSAVISTMSPPPHPPQETSVDLETAQHNQKRAGGGSFTQKTTTTEEEFPEPEQSTRLLRTLSLNYEEEVSNVLSSPSPMSRNNFRKRRLTYAKRGSKITSDPDLGVAEKTIFKAPEIGEVASMDPPFPPSSVGTFSCHGIEPAYDEVDRSDVVVAKINQDRGCVVSPYGGDSRQALFAAYDGHGEMGELVSGYAMHEIQHRLENHPSFIPDIETAFKETFISVDESLKSQPSIDCMYSGTTAVVVLARGNRLYIANAGDSRAVMASRNRDGMIVAKNLSEDQNPNNPVEQARIEAAGGFVSPPPEPGLSARVWLDKDFTQIGLAMGRSIGDHAVSPVGVIAEPEVTHHDITSDDVFMIAASDGVWEFITSQQAVDIVTRYLPEGATKACEVLIEKAAELWREEEGDYRDDITAVIVKVHELWEEEGEPNTPIKGDGVPE
ncbi:hypothetical protein TrCOL_g3382 [Triparma columacea]|uniref:PPM-type phosphatase domain-containing protein n=1 Tax=Triparma columacea TaxID=722753 RepID=A0A9W7L1E8_9STRA|nr:hypothetical protein TrCOL_g3382 [Triparma columacea]